MPERKEITCVDCYTSLREMKAITEAGFSNLNKNGMKVVFALLGIVGAEKAMDHIGTPWYVHLGIWCCVAAGFWLVAMSCVQWRQLNLWRMVSRFSIAASMLYASALRIFFYGQGKSIDPIWGLGSNLLWVIIALSVVAVTWDSKEWNGRERRNLN
ncbi:MAG: hypothetical protein GY820_16975 [Gammaproteobacteria bacterium]|nr:hypothetical protein [Gammaproteobacteria bacterium]